MTPFSDLIFVTWFAVAGPALDYLIFWPAFRRRSQADPPRARTWLWAWTIGSSWVLVAIGAALWTSSGRPWASLGGAAALSLPIFAGGHAYQGLNGVLRTGIVGAIYTGVVAFSGSLWPAIAMHTIIDLGGGAMAWLALRDRSPDGDMAGLGQTATDGTR